MSDQPSTMYDLLLRQVEQRPTSEAVRYGELAWTWAELHARVGRCAAALRAAGLHPGDRVATLDFNHPSWLEISLGCAQVGTVNVLVNFRLAPAEIEYVLNDSGAEVLFVGPEFAEVAASLRPRLPKLRRIIQVGGPAGEYEAWLGAEPDPLAHPVHPEDCVLQLYTSGTTGYPKGVLLPHRSALAYCQHMRAYADLHPGDSFLVAMPLFHIGGVAGTLNTLAAGARIVVLRTPEPVPLLELLVRERITHTFLVPALLGVIAALPDAASYDLSALRRIFYGASPMPLPVLRACMQVFPNVFTQVYGMTEACGVASLLGPADHADTTNEHRLLSAGTAVDGVEIEIRDVHSGAPLPTGQLGEVWIRTDQLMTGYWNKREATAAVITEDGWYRSGDAGHLDEDGYLYLTDRIKDMIISGGENIYPAEIERVLAEHPSVEDVTVVGVPDDKWGEVPRAVVVAAAGHTVDPAELLALCRTQLAGYKCPKAVDLVAALPRNATGKILKKDVRAAYWADRDRNLV
ncbi:MAG TPA: long-chain-fatty-acid--CoA ligase [Pseudonocardia sp.]|nr:long-chain-fatty-acid--CoA ligase [Pseudonocardia sp.]